MIARSESGGSQKIDALSAFRGNIPRAKVGKLRETSKAYPQVQRVETEKSDRAKKESKEAKTARKESGGEGCCWGDVRCDAMRCRPKVKCESGQLRSA